MIFTILALIAVVIGVLTIIFSKDDVADTVGAGFTVIGGIFLLMFIIIIVGMHLTASKHIEQNKIQYDGLCKRLEVITSDYEDVSKSDVIADITEWNMGVYNKKFWAYNPWTSWFNPRKVADELNYISLE